MTAPVPVYEALRRWRDALAPLSTAVEEVPVGEALERILRRDLWARHTLPASAVAAMDAAGAVPAAVVGLLFLGDGVWPHREWLVVFGFLCSLASMLPILFLHDVTLAAICLSAGFFFSEFTIGPMWAIPMDIAPRYSGTASGLMNSGSALAAIISPVIAWPGIPARAAARTVFPTTT